MRPAGGPAALPGAGFPRVSGDAPVAWSAADTIAQFSPRERGCARSMRVYPMVSSVFPA